MKHYWSTCTNIALAYMRIVFTYHDLALYCNECGVARVTADVHAQETTVVNEGEARSCAYHLSR